MVTHSGRLKLYGQASVVRRSQKPGLVSPGNLDDYAFSLDKDYNKGRYDTAPHLFYIVVPNLTHEKTIIIFNA